MVLGVLGMSKSCPCRLYSSAHELGMAQAANLVAKMVDHIPLAHIDVRQVHQRHDVLCRHKYCQSTTLRKHVGDGDVQLSCRAYCITVIIALNSLAMSGSSFERQDPIGRADAQTPLAPFGLGPRISSAHRLMPTDSKSAPGEAKLVALQGILELPDARCRSRGVSVKIRSASASARYARLNSATDAIR